MDRAKDAVAAHLEPHNHHSVDIEQVSSPAVTHERVQSAEHHNITTAIDREIHQHHYQTHVQPVAHKEVLPEQHHHKVRDVETRHHHHGKDAETEAALAEQAAKFRDTQEVLPTKVSQSHNTAVGEHVHHHIHDVIQPVIEQETVQQHVVHETIPIHERIDKEPVMHSGNVLPMMTKEAFLAGGGHSLEGGHHNKEHIDYTGDPLKIKGNSSVGFQHAHRHEGLGTTGAPGEMGTETGLAGAAGITGGHHHHHHGASGAGPHSNRLENELDPRVDSDGSKGLGAGATTSGTRSGLGENITGGNTYSSGATGPSTTGTSSTYEGTPRTAGADAGYGNTAGTGLGSGHTGVSETAGTTDSDIDRKPSTTEKLLAKVGLK